MLILLIISLAINAFLLGWGRECLLESRRYKRAMKESDLTVAVLEAMKEKGWGFVVYYKSKENEWSGYAQKESNENESTIFHINTGMLHGQSFINVVSQLQKATGTEFKFNATMK